MTWNPMPAEIVTDRLVLGAWDDADLDPFATMVAQRDPRTLSAPARRGVGGVFAGYCGLTPGHATPAEPEIAYELLRDFHGHGYATEAARAVTDAARDTGRVRLWACVRPWNAASARVLTKVGFSRTERELSDDAGPMTWWTCPLGNPVR
jgi:RimJ/RimL family protein N-acetyltransferase